MCEEKTEDGGINLTQQQAGQKHNVIEIRMVKMHLNSMQHQGRDGEV